MQLFKPFVASVFCACLFACKTETNPDFRKHVQSVTAQVPLQERELTQCLERAKTILGADDLDVALLHHKLGVLYYDSIGTFTNLTDSNRSQMIVRSIAQYDTAYQIRRKKLGETHLATCKSILNQALVHTEYTLEVAQADSLLDIASKVKDVQAEPAFVGELSYERGLCADALNDFKGAQQFHKKALTIFETVHRDYGIVSDNYLTASTAYIQVCNDLETAPEEAFIAYEKAIKTWESMPNKSEFLIHVTSLHFANALTYRKQGNYVTCLRQLQAVRDSHQNNQDTIEIANTDIEIAKTYCLQNDFKAALKAAQQAYQGLKKFNYPDDNPRMAEILTVLGKIYQALGDVPTAQKHYERAIGGIQNPVNQLFRIEAVCSLADLLKNQKQFEASFKSYQLADHLIRMAQGSFKTNWAKTKLAQKTALVYENALETAYRCWKKTKKLQYSIGAGTFMSAQKSILLSESWEQAHHLGQMGVSKTDLNHSKNLEARLKKHAKDLENQVEGAATAFQKTQQMYDDYLNLLKKKYPAFVSTRYIKTPPPSPTEIYKALPDKTACIEYYWGQKSLYTMVYAGGQQQLFTTVWTPRIKNALKSYKKNLQEYDTKKINIFDTASARLLSQILVAPALQFVKNQSIPIQSLIFIPDDTLSYLSFDALHQENTSASKMGAQTHILLEDFAISKELSTCVLLANQTKMLPTSEISMIGFGENYEHFVQKAQNGTDGTKQFAPIQVERPLQELMEQFPKRQFFRLSQQSNTSIRTKLQQAQLVIMAGHGWTDLTNPYQSGIVCRATTGKPEQDFFTATDFYGTDLQTVQLLILVACQMQLGQIVHGEGVLSVGRSVSYAGAPRFISSLWSIPDNQSMQIVKTFCAYINQKMPCNEALRQAKLTYLKTNRRKEDVHPALWAGLELVGNSSALKK